MLLVLAGLFCGCLRNHVLLLFLPLVTGDPPKVALLGRAS